MGIPWGVWKSTLEVTAVLFAFGLLALLLGEIIGPVGLILGVVFFVFVIAWALDRWTEDGQSQ